MFRDDVDIATVSDLVRYCSTDESGDTDDGTGGSQEPDLEMLALETGNVVTINQLRALVHAARSLCEATVRLSRPGQTTMPVAVS